MDRKKFFIFLILFEFIIISLFSNFNKVSAASFSELGVPDWIPTPSEAYDCIGSFERNYASPDKYALYRLTYVRDGRPMVSYRYIFINAKDKFCDNDGVIDCTDCFVCVIFNDYASDLSSKPSDTSYHFQLMDGCMGTANYHDFSNHECTYLFSTFNIYADNSYSDDKIRFLLTSPPTLSMGDIVLQNKDKVLKQVVLLLPIALVTLVSLIGLKKALAILMNFLRKS